MNLIREIQMNKIAFAAFMLGAFTLSPYAKAEEASPAIPAERENLPAASAAETDLPSATRDGLKWSEIRGLGINVKLENDSLVFTGAMPRECAKNRVMSEVESGDGKHKLKIDLPACRNGISHLSAAQQRDLVQVKAAFPARSFDAAVDGEFCLKHSSNNDGEHACDPIMSGGKPLKHESITTVANRRDEAARKEAEELARKEREAAKLRRQAQEQDFMRMATDLCRAGDFQRLGDELEKQRDWFGDLTNVLVELGKAKTKNMESALKKAKTPEELRLAYDALVADPTYDSEKAMEIYGTRRMEMFRASIEDKSQTASALSSVISEMESDLVDLGENKKAKEAAAWAYTSLGNRLRDDKDYSGAENQYEKALRYADSDGKLKIEQEMAKMFLAAAEECLKENKTKPAKCDALAKKARKHMDSAIAHAGRKKGDEAAEELAGMKMEKIQTFGVDGINVKVSGYGSFNPYGGTYDQQKKQMYQTGMQEEYMKRMMQMQMGGSAGAGMMNGGGSFFR